MHDLFAEFGDITNLHLNLDRRTGYVKGYALIEYASKQAAQEAIEEMNGKAWRDRKFEVDWAFVEPPAGERLRESRARHMTFRRVKGRGRRFGRGGGIGERDERRDRRDYRS